MNWWGTRCKSITISFTLDSIRKSEVASEIRSYTDEGYDVKIKIIYTNRYGTYYVISPWTTKAISYTEYTNGYTTQKLVGISYR